MSKNNKMKGLLKGLRYVSQIFDEEEKEAEMQIGFPTDVKHVAHIGWDGPASINSPSWMNEFKAPQGYSSAPLSVNGEMKEDTNSAKWVSEDQIRISNGSEAPNSPTRTIDSRNRAPMNSAKDSSELPKSSGRHSSTTGTESPTKAKSEKHKQRRSTKCATKELVDGSSKPSRHHKDPNQVSDSPSNLPDVPKKTRRKKSKDSGGPTSKSSKCRSQGEEVYGGSSNRGYSHVSGLSAEENELVGITT